MSNLKEVFDKSQDNPKDSENQAKNLEKLENSDLTSFEKSTLKGVPGPSPSPDPGPSLCPSLGPSHGPDPNPIHEKSQTLGLFGSFFNSLFSRWKNPTIGKMETIVETTVEPIVKTTVEPIVETNVEIVEIAEIVERPRTPVKKVEKKENMIYEYNPEPNPDKKHELVNQLHGENNKLHNNIVNTLRETFGNDSVSFMKKGKKINDLIIPEAKTADVVNEKLEKLGEQLEEKSLENKLDNDLEKQLEQRRIIESSESSQNSEEDDHIHAEADAEKPIFKLGSYIVWEEIIGSGSFSVVHKGYHSETKRLVAV